MAFELDYDALDGRPANGSYWTPVQINIGAADQTGYLVFYGYASAEMRKANRPIAGAVKDYAFTPEEFAAAQALVLNALFPDGVKPTTTLYEVLARFAYGVALNRKDVRDPILDDNGEQKKDDEGNLLWSEPRSFFEEAQHV